MGLVRKFEGTKRANATPGTIPLISSARMPKARTRRFIKRTPHRCKTGNCARLLDDPTPREGTQGNKNLSCIDLGQGLRANLPPAVLGGRVAPGRKPVQELYIRGAQLSC